MAISPNGMAAMAPKRPSPVPGPSLEVARCGTARTVPASPAAMADMATVRGLKTAFALEVEQGFVGNYDGSWTEYGSLVGVPSELGASK